MYVLTLYNCPKIELKILSEATSKRKIIGIKAVRLTQSCLSKQKSGKAPISGVGRNSQKRGAYRSKFKICITVRGLAAKSPELRDFYVFVFFCKINSILRSFQTKF